MSCNFLTERINRPLLPVGGIRRAAVPDTRPGHLGSKLTPDLPFVHPGETWADFSDGSRLARRGRQGDSIPILDPAAASPHRALLSIIRDIRTDGADRSSSGSAPDPRFPAYLHRHPAGWHWIRAATSFNAHPWAADLSIPSIGPETGRLRLECRTRLPGGCAAGGQRPRNVRVMKLLWARSICCRTTWPRSFGTICGASRGTGAEDRRGQFSYLGFNLQDPVTARHPGASGYHFIDHRRSCAYSGTGAGRGGHVSPRTLGRAPRLAVMPRDPAHAKALLATAGFGPERPLRLVYKHSGDPFRARLATVIQAQLAQQAFGSRSTATIGALFLRRHQKRAKPSFHSLSWVGIRTPDIFHMSFTASVPPKGPHRGHYRSPRADRIIETARAEQDPNASRPLPSYRRCCWKSCPMSPVVRRSDSRLPQPGRGLMVGPRFGNYDGPQRWS